MKIPRSSLRRILAVSLAVSSRFWFGVCLFTLAYHVFPCQASGAAGGTVFPYSEMLKAQTAQTALTMQTTPLPSKPNQTPASIPGAPPSSQPDSPPEAAAVKPSPFEQYVRQDAPPEIAAELFQFGYDMFSKAPSTFAPADALPVGPDYLLGPGDGLHITVWGSVNTQNDCPVGRDGKITLPIVGTLRVAGLTFSQASALIKEALLRYYRGISVDVSMGSLRAIQIYVVGKAKQPGCYTISSFSTMVNALFAAGGPSKTGTMRDIQLKRGGRTIARLDLYDLLIRGDKTGDARLMPEDVIFIPAIGPLVAVAGNVRVPAIYELKSETMATDLLALAGGVNDVGFKNRLQLLRVQEGKEQRLLEFDLEQVVAGASGDVRLQGGDMLKVYPVAALVERTAHITGPVKNPGVYGLKPGMTVRDLLTYAGGLLRYASQQSELSRIHITPGGPVTERLEIDLGLAMAGDAAHNLEMQGDDYLFVRSVPQWETQQIVALSGEVCFPGIYAVAKGERLSDLLRRAGGFTSEAYLKGAIFTRLSAKKLQQDRLQESVDRMDQDLQLKSASMVQGALSPEEATQDRAAAERQQNFIARMRTVEALGRIGIKLREPEQLQGANSNIALENGDCLYVPRKPEYIQVMGEVYNPEAFIYNPDATIRSYLRKAGGTTSDANERAAYVLKADGTVISKRQEGWFGISWDDENSRWLTGFYGLRLDPGDTVVVPVNIERVFWLREVKDITQIISQIALTAGIVLKIF
ncbi:MAG: SLBB domain-containing protein [Pseudomonadota bacterium]